MKICKGWLQALLSSAPRGFAARSRVLARPVSLAQTGELASRLGAKPLHSFVMCGQTFLGEANQYKGGTYHIELVVYRASQDQFIEYQRRFQLFERLL